MKNFFFIFCVLAFSKNISAQNNSYPVSGNPVIYSYSPMITLQRTTSTGGFTQGIQAKLNDGTDNWYFGALNTGQWLVSKGSYEDPKLVVLNNGNVGIGISAPNAKLAVNGHIRSKEVKVETTNWPDFVFHKNYSLQPLSEVEKFIRINQRLPEMPSASEAEKEGISLGEMNAKLLQKIEELTLHLIEQSKLVQEQSKRIEKLELIKRLKVQDHYNA